MAKKHTETQLPGCVYHIFNRGVNSEDIFKSEENYFHFLNKYAEHLQPIANMYAYCLLRNHFHLLVSIKNEEEILAFQKENCLNELTPEARISQQFAKFFNAYSQAINKRFGRTGTLFDRPFRRIAIKDQNYLTNLVFYIHNNPVKHGFCVDFRNYPHSSYQSYLINKPSLLCRDEVLNWFGGLNAFRNYHEMELDFDFDDY